jgi:LacI family transcriptional regulator
MSHEARGKPWAKRIAVAIDLTHTVPWHFECYRGILGYGLEQGWTFVLNPVLSGPGTTESRASFDGLVGRISPEVAAFASANALPVVNHWAGSPAKHVPRVCPDVAAGSRLMVEHLVAQGFRHLAHVGVEERLTDDDTSLLADVTRTHGLERPEYVDLPVAFGVDRAPMIQAEEWLASWVDRRLGPTGVVVHDSDVACYLAHACHETDIRIPDDLGIVVRDAIDIVVENALPRLTSLDVDYHEVGYQAARLLDALMQGAQVDSPIRQIPPKGIVVRESTRLKEVMDGR